MDVFSRRTRIFDLKFKKFKFKFLNILNFIYLEIGGGSSFTIIELCLKTLIVLS